MKRTPKQIRLIGALAILGLSSAGQAATLSLVAVAVNGEPITPTDFVSVSPGDVIECEIHITGWADDNWCSIGRGDFQACSSDADCPEGCREFLLHIYQFGIDAAGYISGESGVLQPIGWDRPLAFAVCQGDDDCPEGMECTLELPSIVTSCLGPNHDPESGAYIDEGRSDFLFFGFDQVLTAVDTSTPSYRFGGLQFDSPDRGAVDIGQSAYVGTLLLAASDVDDYQGEACGSFVVSFIHDIGETFLVSQDVAHFPTGPYWRWAEIVPQFAPLTINVATEVGACIYPDGTCVEVAQTTCEVTQTSCATAGGLWMAGGSCPDRLGSNDPKRGPASRHE